MKRFLFLLIIGVGGVATLISLGIWQIQRLDWKEGVIAEIDARIAEATAPLPPSDSVTEQADEYRRFSVAGRPTGQELHVLTSGTAAGTGYRVIAAFETMEGRTIMIDRGLLPVAAKDAPPQTDQTQITGTLLWPDDKTRATSAPDVVENIWFAREVPAMARALGSDEIMLVEAEASAPDLRLTQLPVNSASIRNNHLEYVITWFLLALVWAGMTLYFLARTTTKD